MGTLASRIDRVTVYRQGARVERVMALEESATEVRFTGLPLTLDDGSLRARALGDREELAVDVRVGLEVPDEDETLAPAEDAPLERARLEAERCRGEVARLSTAAQRLDALKVVPRPAPRDHEAPLVIPLGSRAALLALRASEAERLGAALAAASAALREAEKALADATEASKRATTAKNARRHELRKVATVSLVGAGTGTRVVLSYAIPHARWSPSYVLTLAGAKAKLGMRAHVAQRSGEDWRGVRLQLSTAAADAWMELPELLKARIGRAQPPRRRAGYREPPEGAEALYADYDRVAGGPAAPRAASGTAKPAEEDTNPNMTFGGMVRGGAPPPPAAPARAAATPAMSFAGATRSPPAPAPAPARARAAPPAPPRGLPSALGAAQRAPQARRESLAEPAAMAGMAATDLEESGATVDGAAPSLDPPAWDLAAESLAFGRLRMRAPSDSGRGELVAVAEASVYLEALGAHVAIDVALALRVAATSAAVDDRALPPGFELARSEDAYDYSYAAALPCDVASDGAFHAVPVADWDAETRLRHVTVPREGQQVYRLLDITSPLDAALLVGPLDVYEASAAGGEAIYRTTTRMPGTPPRGRLEIGLGVEPAIKVARTATFQEETSGLLGGSLSLAHRVSVELRNLLPRPVTVEVRERVPVVRKDDAEVKVEVGAVEPSWESWDQEQSLRGGHLWRVTLEPGATRTLTARYAVKISSKLELVGGNRRES